MTQTTTVEVHVYCARCNRKLRTESSRKVGYGPTCDRRRRIEGEQLTIEGVLVDGRKGGS